MTIFKLTLIAAGSLLSFLMGTYIVRMLHKDLPKEIASDFEAKSKYSIPMIVCMIILVVAFLIIDGFLDDLPATEHFNWKKEGMPAFMAVMMLVINGVRIYNTLSMKIQKNTRNILVASQFVVLGSSVVLVMLLGFYLKA